MLNDPTNVRVKTKSQANPWMGLAVLVVFPLLIPVNVLMWRLALG